MAIAAAATTTPHRQSTTTLPIRTLSTSAEDVLDSDDEYMSDGASDCTDDDLFGSADAAPTTPTLPIWQAPGTAQASLMRLREGPAPLQDQHCMANAHVHSALPIMEQDVGTNSGPWFRLLQIHPGSGNAPISGTLLRRPIFDAPAYRALSYSWSEERPTQRITVSNKNFYITPHIKQALLRLRDPNQRVCLWVDAICIDQENFVERAAQVVVMAQIFDQAIAVCVWLGELHCSDGHGVVDTRLFQALCRQTRPWWRRTWVVLECAYAKQCYMLTDEVDMTLEDFVERWQICMIALEGDLEQVGFRRKMQEHLPFVQTLYDIFKEQKTTNESCQPLLVRLRQTLNRECTLSHDRIFALLSLIPQSEANQLQPDYGAPIYRLWMKVDKIARASPLWNEKEDGPLLHGRALRDACALRDQESVQQLLSTAPDYDDHEVFRIVFETAAANRWDSITGLMSQQGTTYEVTPGDFTKILVKAVSGATPSTLTPLLNAAKSLKNLPPCPFFAVVLTAIDSNISPTIHLKPLLDNRELLSPACLEHALARAISFGRHDAVDLIVASLTIRHDETETCPLHSGKDAEMLLLERLSRLIEKPSPDNIRTVELVLTDIFHVDEDDRLLELAAEEGDIVVLEALIERKARRVGPDLATATPQTLASIFAEGNALYEAIVKAAREGRTDIVSRLLLYHSQAAQDSPALDGALQAACAAGRIEVVRLLISEGVLRSPHAYPYGALNAACGEGHVRIARLLLTSMADLDTTCDEYTSALITSCKRGQAECVRLLFNLAEDGPRGRLRDGFSFVCIKGYVGIAKLLLQHDLDVANETDRIAVTLARLCKTRGLARAGMIELLLEQGGIDARGWVIDHQSSVAAVCAQGDLPSIRIMLKYFTDADDDTLLRAWEASTFAACMQDRVDVFRCLSAAHPILGELRPLLEAALPAACFGRNAAMVKMLLQYGSERGYRDQTAALIARREVHVAVAAALPNLDTIDLTPLPLPIYDVARNLCVYGVHVSIHDSQNLRELRAIRPTMTVHDLGRSMGLLEHVFVIACYKGREDAIPAILAMYKCLVNRSDMPPAVIKAAIQAAELHAGHPLADNGELSRLLQGGEPNQSNLSASEGEQAETDLRADPNSTEHDVESMDEEWECLDAASSTCGDSVVVVTDVEDEED